MRISDWSSDVCSSDLGARVRLKKSQLSLVRRRTNYHVLKRKILMKPKRKTWLKKVYWRHWIRRYAPGRFRLKLKFKSKLKSALIHKHLVALTGGLRMINRLARSEEDTSELQSLMRISYAVFCLKKKN